MANLNCCSPKKCLEDITVELDYNKLKGGEMKAKGSRAIKYCCTISPQSPGKQVLRCHEPLPFLETLFYWVTGIGSIVYTFYEVQHSSWKFLNILNKEDFTEGWKIIGYKKDISNFEWHFWSGYFWKILPWGLGHIAIGSVVNVYFVKHRKHVFLGYSLLSVTYLLGYRTVLFFISHSCICYLASSVGSFIFTWIVSLLLLSTLNYEIFTPWIKSFCFQGNYDDTRYYFTIFVLALVILRYTSFCLERSKFIGGNSSHLETVDKDNYSLPNLLLYVFYLPIFFTGPLITFDQFKLQINSSPQPWTKQRLFKSVFNIGRVIFWAVFVEFSHHFLYHNALLRTQAAAEQVSLWCLLGLGYIEGQYFMIKYLVLYGLPAQIAKLDDLNPPKEPKCISYIYRYSDMWKYFDRGLYDFLRNYIYIPLGGSQVGILKRLLSSLLCFLYIYMWHGQEYYLLLWCLANYLGCSLELIGGQIEKTSLITNIKASYMSPAMMRRIYCALFTPLFLMSVFAIFYFFSGVTVGDIFIKRLVTHAPMQSRVLMCCVIYVNLQNAMEIERWMALKTKTK